MSVNDNKIRLNKFIANNGLCSRREADKFIEAGVVTVNGKAITRLGTKIYKTDVVRFNNTRLNIDPYRYVLLNKAKNYTYNNNHAFNKNNMPGFLGIPCKESLAPINKLNKMETGLLLFTNDYELINKFSNTGKKIKAVYQITLDKPLTQKNLQHIKKGLIINNKKKFFDNISYINGKSKNELGIENSSGGIKLIKQVFEKLNYSIIAIDRVSFAGLTKKDLPRKHYRHLSKSEITILKRL